MLNSVVDNNPQGISGFYLSATSGLSLLSTPLSTLYYFSPFSLTLLGAGVLAPSPDSENFIDLQERRTDLF